VEDVVHSAEDSLNFRIQIIVGVGDDANLHRLGRF
jgi:hypothetical protein